jgi:cell division protein ZapA
MPKSENKDPNRVPVVIFGQTYNVRAEENAAHIEELARYVDTKMRTIADATGTGEPLKVAILAALNIADEFFKVEESLEGDDAELMATAEELVKELDESLREPTQTSPAP